jgi:hypothetical protein
MFHIKVGGHRIDVHFYHDPPHSTWCVVKAEGYVASAGQARCNLDKGDTFVKSEGRKIALTRALAPYPRWFRTKIWKAYWKRINNEIH